MNTFATDYKNPELLHQELNLDHLQAINAEAASDDVLAVGSKMVTCGANLVTAGGAIGVTGPVGGAFFGLGLCLSSEEC